MTTRHTFYIRIRISITILRYNPVFSRIIAQLVQVYLMLLKYFCPISVLRNYSGS